MSFFSEFIKHAHAVGSVTPSSRFLTRAMLNEIAWGNAHHVVELGAGTGVMTHEILRRLPRGAQLSVYENNAAFIETLKKIEDPRLHLAQHSAWDLALQHAPQSIDVVISGLPLSNFSHQETQQLMRAIATVLTPRGVFVQFQYLPLRYVDVRAFFPDTHMRFEWRNVPPACIYVARNSVLTLPQLSPRSVLKTSFNSQRI